MAANSRGEPEWPLRPTVDVDVRADRERLLDRVPKLYVPQAASSDDCDGERSPGSASSGSCSSPQGDCGDYPRMLKVPRGTLRTVLASGIALLASVVAVWLAGSRGGRGGWLPGPPPGGADVGSALVLASVGGAAADDLKGHPSAPVRHSSGFCLGLRKLEAGARPRLWTCSGSSPSPELAFKYDEQEHHLRNMRGLCVDTWGEKLDLWACRAGRRTQQWRWDVNSGQLRNTASGRCVAAEGGGGVKVEVCQGGEDSQIWRAILGESGASEAPGDSFVEVLSASAKQCLQISSATRSSRELSIGPCRGTRRPPTQDWRYDSNSGELRVGDGFCLEAAGSPETAGVKVAACAGVHPSAQRWVVYQSGHVLSVAKGLCLVPALPDGAGSRTRSGAAMILRPCVRGVVNQRWEVVGAGVSVGHPPWDLPERSGRAADQADGQGSTGHDGTDSSSMGGADSAFRGHHLGYQREVRAVARRKTPAASPATHAADGRECLCLFDIDRTLTGRQDVAGQHSDCPSNDVLVGTTDPAFGQGNLTLSELGRGLRKTFCGSCHLGIVSAGSAGGPAEKQALRAALTGASELPRWWSGPEDITSPLVVGCPDKEKAACAKRVVGWYAKERAIHVEPRDVHFFDDHTGNVRGFAAHGYNARQVSCDSRDLGQGAIVGFCGAALAEIVPDKGVRVCDS